MSEADAVFVIAPSCFRDEEYTHTRLEVEETGCRIHVASLEAGDCKGRFGTIAHADLGLDEASERRWDAVIFVGGGGAEVFFDDARAHRMAREVCRTGGICAAICIAPTILARAGLLEGVAATAFPSEETELYRRHAEWTGRPVEVSAVEGTGAWLITGDGPQSAHAFGRAIAEKIADMARSEAQ